MRGHIRKQNGNYYIVVDIGRDHRNKRKQKWFSGYKTQKEAENDLPKILMDLEGGYKDSKNMSFEEYMEEWLRRKKKSVAYGTYHHYESYTRNHIIPGLGQWKINKLDHNLIDSFVEEIKEKELSQHTKLHIYRVLANAIKSGKRYGLKESLLDGVEAPKIGKQVVNCWSGDELDRFLTYLESKNHKMPIMLALSTGMRYGEIVGLKWENINFKNETISVTHQLKNVENSKGKMEWILSPKLKTETSYRTIKIDEGTVDLLRNHKKQQEKNKLETGSDYIENSLVCTTTSGDIMRPTYIRTVLYRTIEKAGITKITFHGLRHTHATMLLADGIHPKVVQERLGHGSVQITLDTYSHVVPGIQDIAAKSIGNSLYKKEEKESKPNKNVVEFNKFI